jgi:hypothetical protein
LAIDRRLLAMPKLTAADLRQALGAMPSAAEPSAVSDGPNHPRSLDRYDGGAHDVALAKILATALLAGPGAPLLYFGQEIGMATTPAPGDSKIDPTPMQWGGETGFTSGVPWTEMGRNAATANVALEDADADSLLNWYRRLAALRHANEALRAGDLEMVAQTNPDLVAWVRKLPASATGSAPVLVVVNLTNHPDAIGLAQDLRQIGLQTANPMMHTLASSALAASGVAAQEPESGPVSINNISLPPFGIYIGELAHQPGLESAPAVEDGVPAAGLRVDAGSGAHGGEAVWLAQDGCCGGGEAGVFGDRSSCRADDVFGAAIGCDDGRNAAGEGFEHDVAEGVGVRGEDEQVHVGVGLGESVAAQDSGEVGVGQVAAQGIFFRAMADDEEAHVAAGGAELAGEAREQRHVLFNREPAHVAQDRHAI